MSEPVVDRAISSPAPSDPPSSPSLISPSDCRPASAIGHRARMELVFACRRGRTVLAHAYAEPPLRVGRLLEQGSIAQLILVCAGPGVFAGDRLEQQVRVESGARVLLVSQAALQVHPGRAATAATLESSYDVAPDATLDCFWDPVIPFAGSRLQQRIDLRVAEGGELFWSDALMSGRAGRGEAWRFDRLDHDLRLRSGGAVRYRERYTLSPPSRLPWQRWRAARAHYLGTTIVCSAAATAAGAEQAQGRLAATAELRAGVDCLAPGLVISRLLASHGPQFAAARLVLRDVFDRPSLRRG